jgi:ferric-dicitrate binding protein FerR (iron transport regulator)
MNKENDIKTIIHKYIIGQSDPSELEEAISLFNDPYHNLELRPTLFEQWNYGETRAQPEIPEEDFSVILDKIHHRINLEQKDKQTGNRRKWIITVPKVAAVLIVGLILGFFIDEFRKPAPAVQYCTFMAPKGSVSQLILPDTTMVFLNSGSQIKYSVSGSDDQREVFLEGEAWFEVTKNKNNPFVVHTPFYDVKVFGTQFNVKAYKADDEIVTTLERGSVQIMSSDKLKINGPKMLMPGEQLIYNPLKKYMEVKHVNTRMFTSWKDNKLIFINMNLKELIVLLERKYGIDIEFADNIVLDYHYDGTIKNETILEILDVLKETLPIRYKIEGQKVVIQQK